MNQELINKFNLTETTVQNGVSFINNVKFFDFPIMKGWEVFLSNGDTNGEPLKDGMLCILGSNKKHWFSFQVPIEVLKDVEVDVVKDMVKTHADSFGHRNFPGVG